MSQGHRETASLAQVRGARRLLATGASLTALGILLSLGSRSGFASVMTVVGLALLVWSLHRVGRLGPDASLRSRS